MTPEKILRKYFGLTAFKEEQLLLIKEILLGRDVLGILPTGYGKSLCYQVPAMMLPGPTLVVSPLISLMKDQVDGLLDRGIPATYINSSLSLEASNERKRNIRKGKYKLIYVSPESLKLQRFTDLLRDVSPAQVAVDEAHCISVWGHDFRPSYLEIHTFIKTLKRRPVVTAFTATATAAVKKDIEQLLQLQDPFKLVGNLDRENLFFGRLPMGNPLETLLQEVEKRKDQQGIIYCQRRKDTEDVGAYLAQKGYVVGLYHGGMEDADRKKVQEDFQYDRLQMVVATSAFGMGIDKPNVRYVLHLGIPKNIESFYQEAGRAGRDHGPSESILLYKEEDYYRYRKLLRLSELPPERIEIEEEKLQKMHGYTLTSSCLRAHILAYFKGTPDVTKTSCGHCANCVKAGQIDFLRFKKKFFYAYMELGGKASLEEVQGLLLGVLSRKDQAQGRKQLKSFGALGYLGQEIIKKNVEKLIQEGALVHGQPSQQAKDFMTKEGMSALFKEDTPYQEALFQRLRDLRRELSRNLGVAPYIIFHDEQLKEIVRRIPRTNKEFMEVPGVGKVKGAKYGGYFLQEIQGFLAEEGRAVDVKSRTMEEDKDSLKAFDTFHLYQEGKTVEELAKILGVVPGTIVERLLKEHKMGKEVHLEDLFQSTLEEEILNTIQCLQTEKLRPIKEALEEKGHKVSYTDLKVVFYKHFGIHKK